MWHGIAWWQAMIALYFVFTTADRLAVVAEHLGLVPVRLLGWLQQRWMHSLEERARRQALDALLTNGITSRLEAVKAQLHDNQTLLASHLEDAQEDRRLATVDRARLSELYDRIMHPGRGDQ